MRIADRRFFGGTPAPLRNRPFAVYWLGGFLSNVGTWLQAVAASVFVYQLTGSALAVGFLNFATFLPILLFSVPSGVLSDRIDRRGLVIASSSVAAILAAALSVLTLTGRATEVHVTITAFAINTAYAFAKPALSSLLPALVSRSDMSEAVSLNSLQFVTGQLVGPLIASLVLATLGAGWAFAINAVTFVGPIVAMLYLVRAGLGRHAAAAPAAEVLVPDAGELPALNANAGAAAIAVSDAAGALPLNVAPPGRSSASQAGPTDGMLSFLRQHRWVGTALLGIVCTSAALEVVRTLSPVLAAQSLHVAESDAGLIVAAQSAGSAIGLLAFVPLRRRAPAVHLASTGLVLQALGALGTSLATSIPSAAVSVALNGVGFALCFPVMTGFLQGEVPDRMRGRVMSLHTIAHLGNRPFTALAAGTLATLAGSSNAMFLGLFLAPIGILAVRATIRRLAPERDAIRAMA